MPNRPAIPTEIEREILVECGHRCAVCGTPCPLERAHIIPWHRSKEHKAEDLICLCANCHERADKEEWGEKALREYKQRPWVLRQYSTKAPTADLDGPMSTRAQQRATDGDPIASSVTAWSSPFIYGRPTQSEEFVDRHDELRTIFNRLRHGQSTAVVGLPHIGKSSLLLKLADKATQRIYLGDDAQRFVVSYLDLHSISSDYSPTTFWEKALKPLKEHCGIHVTQWLEQIAHTGYVCESLEELFVYLCQQGQRLVLLLDEFERLLCHPNFRAFASFAILRALDSFSSFAFITSSRLSLKELNKRGDELPGSGGSPLFNTLIEVRLHPFDEEAVAALLNQAGDAFSREDRRFIRRVAGRYPLLIQSLAAALLETTGDDRYGRACERFYGWISSHFSELWGTLDDDMQAITVLLSLVELGGYTLGHDFEYSGIQQVQALGPGLKKAVKLGLAEQIGADWPFNVQFSLVCHGERWTVGTYALAWWVRDVVITTSQTSLAHNGWLTSICYSSLLTQEQWNWLTSALCSASERAGWGIEASARVLFDDLMEQE